MGWGISAVLFAVFVALTIYGNRKHKVFVAELLSARRNPSCEEFLQAMGPEISADIALWAWDKIVLETGPEIAPWPDEVLDMDLGVDPEEFDWWVADFCKTHGINPRDLSDWPSDSQVTARALGRWLTVEQSRLA